MNDDSEKLKAMHTYLESLRASIEMLEIKVDFFESVLPELDPDLYQRYQSYVHDRLKNLKEDPKTALGFLLSQRE